MEEQDETRLIARIAAVNRKTLFVRDGVTRRGQHPKHHGCVRAKFETFDGIPAEYRSGIFAVPRQFDALVRFSNGSAQDDREPDAHGMAIKLVAVEGPKVLAESLDPHAQDFILTDHPVFFSTSLEEYLVFNAHFTRILDFTRNWHESIAGFLPRLVGLVQGAFALVLQHPGLLRRARRFAGARPASPLKSNYWSTTPYLLGSTPVKYMVRPEAPLETGGVRHADGLGETLRDELSRSAATFTFGVHPRSRPDEQPVEDTTDTWHADPAGFVALARITIPRQAVDSGKGADAMAEKIVFSPWHALREHEPLGAINRARKVVYLEMARARLAANGQLSSGASAPNP